MGGNTGNNRLDILDYLRGFALMGIVLVNILSLLAVPEAQSGTVNGLIRLLLNMMIESRFFLIFSFLFGVGFYIFITRAKEKGANSTLLFSRRLIALLILGIVHQFFQPGEALFFYAIFGFTLLPFYKVKPQVNLIFALVMLVPSAIIGGKVLLILPMFWLGLAMGQYGVFSNIAQYMPIIKNIQWTTLILTVIGLYIQFRLYNDNLPLILVGVVMSTFYVTTLILLLQKPIVQKLLTPLKYYGRMALTNYLGQTAIILGLNSLFDLYAELGEWQTTLICLGIYLCQMTFSMIWLSYFTFGPLEWIWRLLTYWKIPPIKKTQPCSQ